MASEPPIVIISYVSKLQRAKDRESKRAILRTIAARNLPAGMSAEHQRSREDKARLRMVIECGRGVMHDLLMTEMEAAEDRGSRYAVSRRLTTAMKEVNEAEGLLERLERAGVSRAPVEEGRTSSRGRGYEPGPKF
jgi:hypothetical protein